MFFDLKTTMNDSKTIKVINYNGLFRGMLTEIERSSLIDRDQLTVKARRDNEFKIRRKFKKWIADAEDVQFLLDQDHLPRKQLEKIIKNNNIEMLMGIVLKSIYIAGATHIIKDEFAFTGQSIRASEMKEELTRPSLRRGYVDIIRKATPEEIDRAAMIVKFIDELLICLGEDDIGRVAEKVEENLEAC